MAATRMQAGERREQLLDATKAIVGERGFHAVSIEAVAREAGHHAARSSTATSTTSAACSRRSSSARRRARSPSCGPSCPTTSAGDPREALLASLRALPRGGARRPRDLAARADAARGCAGDPARPDRARPRGGASSSSRAPSAPASAGPRVARPRAVRAHAVGGLRRGRAAAAHRPRALPGRADRRLRRLADAGARAVSGFDAARLERIREHFDRYVEDGRLPGYLVRSPATASPRTRRRRAPRPRGRPAGRARHAVADLLDDQADHLGGGDDAVGGGALRAQGPDRALPARVRRAARVRRRRDGEGRRPCPRPSRSACGTCSPTRRGSPTASTTTARSTSSTARAASSGARRRAATSPAAARVGGAAAALPARHGVELRALDRRARPRRRGHLRPAARRVPRRARARPARAWPTPRSSRPRPSTAGSPRSTCRTPRPAARRRSPASERAQHPPDISPAAAGSSRPRATTALHAHARGRRRARRRAPARPAHAAAHDLQPAPRPRRPRGVRPPAVRRDDVRRRRLRPRVLGRRGPGRRALHELARRVRLGRRGEHRVLGRPRGAHGGRCSSPSSCRRARTRSAVQLHQLVHQAIVD